jgi:hypothetical protein
MLFSHLLLGLPKGRFPTGLPVKILKTLSYLLPFRLRDLTNLIY